MTDHAAVSGVNATKYAAIKADTAGIGSFIDGANEWGTKVRCIYDEYTVIAGDTVAASATLTFGTLPKGAKPLFAVWTQSQTGGGATTGGIQIGAVAATAAAVLTTMTEPTTQIVPINNTFTTTFTSAAVAVTVVLSATADLDALVNATLAIFYITED